MDDRAAILAELLADPMRARLVPRIQAVELLLELARVTRALELLTVPEPKPEFQEPGAPITVEDVMQLTGLNRRAVFSKSHGAQWQPFVIREGRKTLHFRPAFREYYAKRRACR